MIKNIVLGILLCLSISSFAQDDPLFKVRKSELGIDVTSLIGRTLAISRFGFFEQEYQPTYYLIYRQHFSTFRLRALAGGRFDSNNLDNEADRLMNIDYKLGIETITNLGRKWQIFYGLDLAVGHDYRYNEQSWTGQLYEYKNDVDYFGVAPFLGLKFFISNRMNISVETSLLFRRNIYHESRTWISTVDPNPTQDPLENIDHNYAGFSTEYIAPDFIVFGFKL
jgi:hypothetical protein